MTTLPATKTRRGARNTCKTSDPYDWGSLILPFRSRQDRCPLSAALSPASRFWFLLKCRLLQQRFPCCCVPGPVSKPYTPKARTLNLYPKTLNPIPQTYQAADSTSLQGFEAQESNAILCLVSSDQMLGGSWCFKRGFQGS